MPEEIKRLKLNELDKDMRLEGMALRIISPLGSERVQRALSPISNTFLSALRLKKLNCNKLNISRKDGSQMRVCIMKSNINAGRRVGVLWFHGGGYSLGAPEMAAISFPKKLLENMNCVIVSPDYTLSAKAPYPAAFRDACTALDWVLEHRKQLGIESEKIIVGGESAGGGLAAALSIYARDTEKNCFAFQIPLYPMLDDRVTKTSLHNDSPVWGTTENRSAWRIYLGDRVMNQSVPVYAAPARETDLSGLPPVISAVGTADPFYFEDITFFSNIRSAGTEVKLFTAKGAYHAFDMMAPYAKVSKTAVSFLLAACREFIDRYL